MKNSILLSLLVLVLAFSSACSKDDDEIIDAVLYDLTVDNQTTLDLDLYLKTDLDNTGFVNNGTVLTGQEKVISDLVIDVNYTLRIVQAGMSVDSVFAEQEFINDDPDAVDLKITITE